MQQTPCGLIYQLFTVCVGDDLLEIAKGTLSCLVLLAACSILMIIMLYAARKGRVPKIRKIPAVDAIDEAIGRATEMGRPVHYSTGTGDFYGYDAMVTIAGISVLGYVAKKIAQYNTPLIVTFMSPEVEPVVADVVKQAYLAAGRPDAFKPDMIRFISQRQFAYATGVIGILNREKVAANVMIGHFMGEAMIIAEAGYMAGAVQIGGTANTIQLPFFVAACDYTLISEEVYAAGAYLSKDPLQLGAVAGQDWARLVGVVLIGIGTILATLGVTWVADILKL